ncbi:uncharacterized protein IUM83_02014 [Phytophthora cinnamomi]|uniref:uncharacterized protein n=1 Tax=Phytophthora cinnamomi TaxID=4785 RepID=UPI003559E46F|nr:hypothetical protein IUM83_02014 [Phytophthora cinnamomi]
MGAVDLRAAAKASSGSPSTRSISEESESESGALQSRLPLKASQTACKPGFHGDEHTNYEESDPEDGGGQERQCQCAYLSQVKVRIRSTSEAKTVTAIRIFASDLAPTMVTFLLFK